MFGLSGNKSNAHQKKAKELENYLRELSNFVPLSLLEVNSDMIITEANSFLSEITGYEKERLIGENIDFLFNKKEKIKKIIKKTLEGQEFKKKEFILSNNLIVNAFFAPRKNSREEIVGVFVAFLNISEIKQFRKKLKKKVAERTKDLEKSREALMNILEDTQEARQKAEEERQKTRGALKGLDQGVVIFDKKNRINWVNPTAEDALDIKEVKVKGKRMEELVEHSRIRKVYKALGGEIRWTGRKQEIVFKKPLERFFQLIIHPLAIEGKQAGLILVMNDITRQKQVGKLKTEFVSIAAHQLRTPLSGIKWTLKMLLDGDVGKLTEEQKELVKEGFENNERMIVLVNDLLNVARIEEGRFAYNQELISLEGLIEDKIKKSSTEARKNKVEINFKKPSSPAPKVKVDKEKIGLVIDNLIENAIHYSPEGETVTIGMETDKMNVRVMVEDNGIGIPGDQYDRIFTKFFRADNATKSDVEGNGLGLFICKNIIESHGGRIWFESELDKGTTFWFSLPAAK